MKKLVAYVTVILFLGMLALSWAASDNPLAIPAEVGVRIRSVQLDKEKAQGRLSAIQLQLQAQWERQTEGDRKLVESDDHELQLLQDEAFKTAGRSKDEFNADLDKLVFVPKPPKPAAPEAKK